MEPALQEIIDQLEEALGSSVALFEWAEGWNPRSLPPSFEQHLQRIRSVSSDHTAPFPISDTQLVGLPWEEECERFLAIVKLELPKDDALRMATLAAQNVTLKNSVDRLQHEVDQCALQICRDFEELTFLQRMIESLEKSTAEQSFSEVANYLLPDLLTAMEACAVAFVDSDETSSIDLSHQNDVIQSGASICELNDWKKLVDSHWRPDLSENDPTVCNHVDAQLVPNIKRFVMMPVQSKGRLFGWLIAANRSNDFIDRNSPTESESEFGTFEATLLKSAASVIATYGVNRELLTEKESLLMEVVVSFVSAIDAKDDYTQGHSLRVAKLGSRLAKQLGLSETECNDIYFSGLLHDIGKIGVPDEVLNKKDRLTDEEFEKIKQHPDLGWSILHRIQALQHLLPGVIHHHEEFNGSGYPDGLAGDSIPLMARILSVVDAYDAITSNRSYRPGKLHELAMEILADGADSQWDAKVIQAAIDVHHDLKQICDDHEQSPRPKRHGSDVEVTSV